MSVLLERTIRTCEQLRANPVGLSSLQAGRTERRQRLRLPAKITSSTAIGGATFRWLYEFQECEITPSNVFQLKSDGLTGEALNLAEGDNNATTVANGVLVANLPGSFEPKPLTGYVWLEAWVRTDGSLVWLITKALIDGECT